LADVAVVGAGPYGLSVAAHLRGAGVPFRIFGEPLEMWRRHMPKGMLLKSDAFASNLSAPDNAYPLSAYCRETGHPYEDVGFRTPLATIIEYAHEFQRRHVGVVEQARVMGVTQATGGYSLQLDTGETAFVRKVILATGLSALKHTPDALASLPEGTVSHSADHHDLSPFAGRRVAVVGGGQSAVETAALLHEQGAQVALVSRRPILWFSPDVAPDKSLHRAWMRVRRPNFGLGPGWRVFFWSEMPRAYSLMPQSFRLANAYSQLGPAGSDWTRHRVDGVLPIHCGTLQTVEYRQGEIQLTLAPERQTLAFDHVVAATGYKPDIGRLPFLQHLLPSIAAVRGIPVLDQHFGSVSAAGLYFVGYLSAATFGPSMRFIYGTQFAATRLARHIALQYQGRRGAGSLLPKPA
jgi:pyridine nucleotide-disulfide oxidoreductase